MSSIASSWGGAGKNKKSYPKAMYRNVITLRSKGTLCSCCEDVAAYTVVIANNADPEQNEKHPTCQRHTTMAFDSMTLFFKHFHGRQENLKYERSLNDNNTSANQGA